MTVLFGEVWKASLLCSVGILLILAVSPLLRKTYTVFWRYCLWLLLAVRLLLPFDFRIPGWAVEIPLPVSVAEVEKEEMKNPASEESRSFSAILPADEQRADAAGQNELSTEHNLPVLSERAVQVEKSDSKKSKQEAEGKLEDSEPGAENLVKNIQEANTQPNGKNSESGAENIVRNTQEADIQLNGRNSENMFQWAAVIWAAGVAVCLVWQIGCYLIFAKK